MLGGGTRLPSGVALSPLIAPHSPKRAIPALRLGALEKFPYLYLSHIRFEIFLSASRQRNVVVLEVAPTLDRSDLPSQPAAFHRWLSFRVSFLPRRRQHTATNSTSLLLTYEVEGFLFSRLILLAVFIVRCRK